jgi:hypothetical protein
MVGAKPEEIKNKLPERYTLSDIDKVCESYQSYSMRLSKLPFDLKNSEKVQIQVKAPIEESFLTGTRAKIDDPDEVDDSLISLGKQYLER